MKKLVLLLTFIIYFSNAYSNNITAIVNNGNWNNSATWNQNRIPADNDTVTIPTSKTVIINNIIVLNNVTLHVNGTLLFQNFLSSLVLNSSSSIIVNSGGSIQGIPGQDFIYIGADQVFNGITISGPKFASSATGNGFAPMVTLPVKFNSFTLSHSAKAIIIQWSTSEELNSYNYEIERSTDGSNWQSISTLPAKGISTDISNYSYTDNSTGSAILVYYRIKEVDKSGQAYYTPIKSIKNSENAQVDIQIVGSNGKVWIQFSQQIKGDVLVQFISTSGTVVGKQMLYQPVGQQMIQVSQSMKGNYFVFVSNGQDIKTSKQVIL